MSGIPDLINAFERSAGYADYSAGSEAKTPAQAEAFRIAGRWMRMQADLLEKTHDMQLIHATDLNATGLTQAGSTVNVIGNISVSAISSTTATISWDVNPDAGGQVIWGTDPNDLSNSGPVEINDLPQHVQNLSGFPAGSTIYYRILSGDAESDVLDFDTTVANAFPPISTAYQRTDSNPPARPTAGNSVVDPFDANITIKNMGQKFHFYSSRTAFSADSTRVILGYEVVDIASNTVIYTISDSNGEHAFSHVDSDIIFACFGGSIRKINISTGAVTTVATFAGYDNCTMGRFEGSPSADDRYIPIVGISGGTDQDIFICDTVNGNIVNNNKLPVPSGFDNVKLSHSGSHAFIAANGTVLIAPVSDVSNTSTTGLSSQHSDTATENVTGDDCLVLFTTGSTVTVLKTDGSNYVINLGFNTSNGHISGRCVSTQGMCLISSYSTRQLVGLIIQQGTAQFRHYGFHRGADFADATRTDPNDPGIGYRSIAKSCVSPDFSRMISHAEWNSSTTRECYIQTYG